MVSLMTQSSMDQESFSPSSVNQRQEELTLEVPKSHLLKRLMKGSVFKYGRTYHFAIDFKVNKNNPKE